MIDSHWETPIDRRATEENRNFNEKYVLESRYFIITSKMAT